MTLSPTASKITSNSPVSASPAESAPSASAAPRRCAEGSAATITAAPRSRASCRQTRPIAPQPITPTLAPGGAPARFHACTALAIGSITPAAVHDTPAGSSQIERIDATSRTYGVTIVTVAHAGDGNLHPIFVFDRATPEPPAHVWAAADEVFTAALGLGGTLTGEHGVGALKRRWLGQELDPDTLAVHQAIKHALDPAGLLNPGKAL